MSCLEVIPVFGREHYTDPLRFGAIKGLHPLVRIAGLALAYLLVFVGFGLMGLYMR